MLTSLALLRHGRASGQSREATLTEAGLVGLDKLAGALAEAGWAADQVFTSPYVRATATAERVAPRLAPGVDPEQWNELAPDADPETAIAALRLRSTGNRVLVVSHLPLLGRLAWTLTGIDPGFTPGTFVDIEHWNDPGRVRIARQLRPEEIPAGDAGGESS